MAHLTIGKLARQAGVGVETIRFYERVGLIEQPFKPSGGGYRLYSGELAGRIGFIRQAQELGFSLREIGELLALKADPGSDCAQVKQRARKKRAEVNEKINRLRKIGEALNSVIDSCPSRGVLGECPIMAALDRQGAEENIPEAALLK